MVALAHPVGVAIGNKATFKGRNYQITQGVMHHPVPNRRGRDQAPFGFVDVEAIVRSGSIGLGLQLQLKLNQVVFQTVFKGGYVSMPPFTPAGIAIGQPEIIPATEFGVDLALPQPLPLGGEIPSPWGEG